MASQLELYHRLPPPLKSLIASTRGHALKSWRYGPDTERLIEMARAREDWSAAQWKNYQDEKLARQLWHAARRVPYYRNYWQKRGAAPSQIEDLSQWPILTKQTLREHADELVAENVNRKRVYRGSTSGTTGTPLSLFISRAALRAWYALFEARTRRWHNVSMNQRWAIMGGQVIVPFEQTRPPFGVVNHALHQLYLSTHHLSAQNAPWYAEELARFRPTHLIVYPSSANVLATEVLRQNLQVPPIEVVFSNAEYLQPAHKENIERAFGCAVRNTYGMGEAVLGASECEHGTMHLWPESGILEVLSDENDAPAPPDESGRFVITGLLNRAMPLIRYEVGDRGKMAPPQSDGEYSRCACGRALPVLATVDGRTNDLIVTRDGRRVFWINPVFYGLPIREAQVVQESLDLIRVRYVPTESWNEAAGAEIVSRMQARVGDMKVQLEAAEHLPREKTGKLRAVISHVAQDASAQDAAAQNGAAEKKAS